MDGGIITTSEDSGLLPAKPTAGPRKFRDPTECPMRKLTVNLLATYKEINAVYYRKKKERQLQKEAEQAGKTVAANVYDYVVKVGDMLGTRYRVLESLGKGSFGQVVSATDTKTGNKVAVKVIKNKEAFRRQARTEIRLLKMLNEKDPSDQWCIVRFEETFQHNGHTCLVFEHLSFNLYELLKRTHFNGVSLNLVRKFARQILKTLAYMSLPDVDVIHCDLKPENILFRVPNRSAIKVIDFGSSCKAKEQMYVYIQSRFYRSPEVILGLPYSQAIDMWSLGCILVEMHTGTPLFSGRDEHDQIRRFCALKGLPPTAMLEKAKKTSQFFTVEHPKPYKSTAYSKSTRRAKHSSSAGSELDPAETVSDDSDFSDSSDEEDAAEGNFKIAREFDSGKASGDSVSADATGGPASPSRTKRRRDRTAGGIEVTPPAVYKLKPRPKSGQKEITVYTNLRDVIGVHTGGPSGRRKSDKIGHSEATYIQFLDLVERMLDYDPATRIKPMQALNHPFLREEEAQSPDAAAASAAPVGHTTRVSVSTLAMEADDNKSMLNAAVFASAIPSTGKSAAAPSSLPAVKRTGEVRGGFNAPASLSVAATAAGLSALSIAPSTSTATATAAQSTPGSTALPPGLPPGGQIIHDSAGMAYYIPPPGTAVPLSLIATASLDPSAGSSGGTKPSAGGTGGEGAYPLPQQYWAQTSPTKAGVSPTKGGSTPGKVSPRARAGVLKTTADA